MRYVLPGMGATSAMFTGPWLEIGDIQFLDWPFDSKAQSIDSLAKEIIEYLRPLFATPQQAVDLLFSLRSLRCRRCTPR